MSFKKLVVSALLLMLVVYGFSNFGDDDSQAEKKSVPNLAERLKDRVAKNRNADTSALPKPRESAMVRKLPRNFQEDFHRADELLQSGEFELAVDALKKILNDDPTNQRALEELGMIYMTEMQDPQGASEFFRRALSANPDNEFAVMELVGVSSHPDRAGEALEFMQKLNREKPSAVLADGIGELLMSQGKLAEALPYLEKSAKSGKHAEFAHTRIASVHQQMGNFDLAADNYRKSIAENESEIEKRKAQGQSTEMVEADRSRTQMDLLEVLLQQGKVDEAADLLDRIPERDGDRWEREMIAERIERARHGG